MDKLFAANLEDRETFNKFLVDTEILRDVPPTGTLGTPKNPNAAAEQSVENT